MTVLIKVILSIRAILGETQLIPRSLGQVAMNWPKWQADTNIVASYKLSNLQLHNPNDTEPSAPRIVCDFKSAEIAASDEIFLTPRTKFLTTVGSFVEMRRRGFDDFAKSPLPGMCFAT